MKTDERMCKRAYSSFLVSSLKLFICSVQPEGSVISLMVFIRYAMLCYAYKFYLEYKC